MITITVETSYINNDTKIEKKKTKITVITQAHPHTLACISTHTNMHAYAHTCKHTHIPNMKRTVISLLSDGSESESVSTTVSLGGGSFSANKSRPDLNVSIRESC